MNHPKRMTAIDKQHKCQFSKSRQRGLAELTIGMNLNMGEQNRETTRHQMVSKLMTIDEFDLKSMKNERWTIQNAFGGSD